MFDRIEIDEEQNLPVIRDTEILVADVLEALAHFSDLEVLKHHPELEREDLREALLFAAEILRDVGKLRLSVHEQEVAFEARLLVEYPTEALLILAGKPPLRESENFLGVRLALKNPSNETVYLILDVEDEKTLLKATAFQVEYLKNNCHEPSNPEEGWYFGKVEASNLITDMQRVVETLEMVDKRIVALEAKREANPDAEINDELAKLVVRAELFETKIEELEALQQAMAKALGDYDAFEFTWKPIKEV